jgi:glutamine amidotransferase
MSEVSLKLGIIDYGMGNLRSVLRAWQYVGADVCLVSYPDQILGLDALIFPGQGAIVDTMVRLRETGFDDIIKDWIAADKPFFGICLGLQALFEFSEEGNTPGLGVFPGRVCRFRFAKQEGRNCFKIPHMGWNNVNFVQETPVNIGLESGEQFYFVHSYYVETPDSKLHWGLTEYGGIEFVSAIRRGNCFATQFHPEKSQANGLHLYKNYLCYLSNLKK